MSDRFSPWGGGSGVAGRSHGTGKAPAAGGAQIVSLDEYRARRTATMAITRTQPLMWHEMVE